MACGKSKNKEEEIKPANQKQKSVSTLSHQISLLRTFPTTLESIVGDI
jgi:hypothetical protein